MCGSESAKPATALVKCLLEVGGGAGCPIIASHAMAEVTSTSIHAAIPVPGGSIPPVICCMIVARCFMHLYQRLCAIQNVTLNILVNCVTSTLCLC